MVVVGSAVDVVYIDYNKAFGMVPHGRLVQKARNHGIQGKLQTGCLTNRRVEHCFCDWKPVTSGVPQGPVPGLLLFATYINNLEVNVEELPLEVLIQAVQERNEVPFPGKPCHQVKVAWIKVAVQVDVCRPHKNLSLVQEEDEYFLSSAK
eukprot:g31652.t1